MSLVRKRLYAELFGTDSESGDDGVMVDGDASLCASVPDDEDDRVMIDAPALAASGDGSLCVSAPDDEDDCCLIDTPASSSTLPIFQQHVVACVSHWRRSLRSESRNTTTSSVSGSSASMHRYEDVIESALAHSRKHLIYFGPQLHGSAAAAAGRLRLRLRLRLTREPTN